MYKVPVANHVDHICTTFFTVVYKHFYSTILVTHDSLTFNL